VVERREGARQIVGLVVRRRACDPDADRPRRRPDDGGDQQRVEHRRTLSAVPDRVVESPAVLVRDAQDVGEEDQVELAALQGAGDLLVVLGREEAARVGLRQAPRRVAMDDRM
jgi:hypothetical protein